MVEDVVEQLSGLKKKKKKKKKKIVWAKSRKL